MAKIDEAERTIVEEKERLAQEERDRQEEKERRLAEEEQKLVLAEEAQRKRIKEQKLFDYFAPDRETKISDIRTYWEEWWRNLGVKFDPAGIVIPPRSFDFDHLLMMPKGLKLNFLRDVCKGLFNCALPDNMYNDDRDLEGLVVTPSRSQQAYAVRLYHTRESNVDPKKLSGSRAYNTIDLPERMVYEIDCFKATGEHLDTKNRNLCAKVSTRYPGQCMLIWWGEPIAECFHVMPTKRPEIGWWNSPEGCYLRLVLE